MILTHGVKGLYRDLGISNSFVYINYAQKSLIKYKNVLSNVFRSTNFLKFHLNFLLVKVLNCESIFLVGAVVTFTDSAISNLNLFSVINNSFEEFRFFTIGICKMSAQFVYKRSIYLHKVEIRYIRVYI